MLQARRPSLLLWLLRRLLLLAGCRAIGRHSRGRQIKNDVDVVAVLFKRCACCGKRCGGSQSQSNAHFLQGLAFFQCVAKATRMPRHD